MLILMLIRPLFRVKLEAAGIVIRTVRGLGYYLEKPNGPVA
jgi:DNA-binding response OmpR family regulator